MSTGVLEPERKSLALAPPWWQRLFAPVDIASLVFFRIAFGLIMAYEVFDTLRDGRMDDYWVEPAFNFPLGYFDWVRPWPEPGIYIHWCALGLLGLCIAAGFAYRLVMPLFCLGFTYIFLLEESRYLNHYYFICLVSFLMIFIPAHRALSLDARLRPRLRASTTPSWTIWILCFQMGVVYFFGGIAKLNADWLRGEPMRFWLASRTEYPVLGAVFDTEPVVYLFSYGGLLLDLLIVPLLLWRRTRLFAFFWAVCFHCLNKWILGVGIFPLFSIVMTLLFFPPGWPRRLLTQLRFRHVEPGPILSARPPRGVFWSGREKATVLFLGIFVAIQLLVPWRKHLYPGHVNWTEEGHNFSWHMKLRDKSARAIFTVRSLETGKSWELDLREWLTPRQIRKMTIRPHMILKFGRIVARELQAEHPRGVEVRAEVWCSLNGRRPALLIDPNVDLASVRRSIWPAPWILPLQEPLPPPANTLWQAAWARGEIDPEALTDGQRRRIRRLEGD